MDKEFTKEFEEVIDEICGKKKELKYLSLPEYNEFLKDKIRKYEWTYEFLREEIRRHEKVYFDKEDERCCSRISCSCKCGAEYLFFVEQNIPYWKYNNYGEMEPFRNSQYETFFCVKCGKMMRVMCENIYKVKSKQLEVVL